MQGLDFKPAEDVIEPDFWTSIRRLRTETQSNKDAFCSVTYVEFGGCSGICTHPTGSVRSTDFISFKSCTLVPALMDSLLGV